MQQMVCAKNSELSPELADKGARLEAWASVVSAVLGAQEQRGLYLEQIRGSEFLARSEYLLGNPSRIHPDYFHQF